MNCPKKAHHILILAWLFLLLFGAAAEAQQGRALLLYKGSEEVSPTVSRVGTRVDPILQSLGYTSTYHDIDSGLPSVDADVIVTWFASPKIADPEAYVDWMAKQISQGRKVIVLGNFGAHTSDGKTWMTNESLNRFFYPFGLSYGAAYTGDTNLLKVTRQQSPAAAPSPLNYYLLFSSVNPNNKILMEVDRTDQPDSKSALVVQTPYGAMAQETYVDKLDLKTFVTDTVKSQRQVAATKRKLLGLYKSSENVDARTNFLARFVAPTLFDLGYGIDYHDIDSGLPSAQQMENYDGIISWYITAELAKAADYIDWLSTQIDANRRIIILGNFGAFAEDIQSSGGVVTRFLQSPEYNRFFFPFGLEFRGAWTPEKKSVVVERKDSSVMTWLDPGHVGHYYWIRSLHPDNQEYLTVKRQDLQDGESAVVVATPHGGLALESYVLSTDPTTNQPRLHLDLKKFLNASLTLQSTTATDLKPNVANLVSKPPLPAITNPIRGGDGQYPPGVTPIKRKILAFYHSDIDEEPVLNATYLSAQATLEHLGLIVTYHDAADPNLPSAEEMKDYRGIVLWLGSGVIPNAREFDAWLLENVAAGRKLALLGDYELREKSTLSLVSPKKVYAALGLDYDVLGNAPIIQNAKGMRSFKRAQAQQGATVREDPELMNFEHKVDWQDQDLKASWHLVRSVWPDSKIGLTVTRVGGASDVVVISKTGGVAIGPFPVWNKGIQRKTRNEVAAKDGDEPIKAEETGGNAWRVDPYRFFTQVFELDKLPRPDVTTLNGSRIYYSHIDGDAFGGMSRIDMSSLNGEMMYQRVLKGLPLPVTVSYVTKDIETRLDQRYSRELGAAEQIFKLPNVEAASHTYSHPFDWQKGDLALSDTDYKLVRQPVDLGREIVHSIDFVDKLCPPDKRCEILLWSGRCNPSAKTIELVREHGLPNMNGGEPVLSPEFPNIAGVLPLYADKGGETQYHVSAAGDFFYTSSWTGEYDGMKHLPEYFERTESPRRLRCLNVYYHFYLAEREPGIAGLKTAYDDVLKRSPAPMFASEYADLLRDSLETKMGTDSQGRFWLSNSGLNSTVRFDNESRYPDLDGSTGVIGFNRANGALYVHLDGRGEAHIALTEQPTQRPYLVRFTQRVKQWKAGKTDITFTAEGQGPAYLQIGNLVPSSPYRIETDSLEATLRTDGQGTLIWQGRFDGYQKSHPVRIRKVNP
jgi:polysaccharide biosynthesis protein PelA